MTLPTQVHDYVSVSSGKSSLSKLELELPCTWGATTDCAREAVWIFFIANVAMSDTLWPLRLAVNWTTCFSI